MSKPIVAALLVLSAACAETNAPLPEPVEVLLVVNSVSATLSLIPVDAPATALEVSLGAPSGAPTGLAARDSIAVVPLGTADAVTIVNLHTSAVIRTIQLPEGSGATGAAIVSDSIAYVANPGLNSVTRINMWNGDTAEVAIGVTPQEIVFARGRLFILNGNLATEDAEPEPVRPSWIAVVDPATNALATGIDSIPLTGPGNAKFAAIGRDGLLYVVSVGANAGDEGRLSIVDPVGRTEVASFAGFGLAPGNVAADSGDRMLVSSRTEGLMAFDTQTRTVTRGAGSGVAIPSNSAVVVDSRGRIYAIEAGACTLGSSGVAHVLDGALVERRTLGLGACPVAAAVVQVP